MFGYVRVAASELKVREYQYYQAIYCGLCRAQGKCTGQCSRMTLSYDFAFMAAVRMALSGTRPQIAYKTCLPHPFHKRPYVVFNEDLANCAWAAGILAGLKCRDDLSDERGFGKIKAWFRWLTVKPMYRKALKKAPEETQKAGEWMSQIAELEKSREGSVDKHAILCGELLGTVFSLELDGPQAKIAKQIGLHLGKLIDMLDAADDWEKDLLKHRYNPLICLYPDATPGDKNILDNLKLAMYGELAATERAVDLLDLQDRSDLQNILYNVLHIGLPDTIERVTGEVKDTRKQRKGELNIYDRSI